MHLLVEPGPGQLGQTSCVMRIGLVRLQRFQALMRLPCIDADDGNTQSPQPMADYRRHPAGFDHRAFDAADLIQYMCDHVGSALDLYRGDLSTAFIDNADLRGFHRQVQSGIMFHGCFLPSAFDSQKCEPSFSSEGSGHKLPDDYSLETGSGDNF